jgi:murein L,D-transpeptidase YcbB/YkuD
MPTLAPFRPPLRLVAAAALAACVAFGAAEVRAQVTPFMQAVAEAAADDRELAAFYRGNEYQPIWTGDAPEDVARRTALLSAIERAGDHGLPVDRYRADLASAKLRGITTERELGHAEVAFSRLYLDYAHHISSGILIPREVDGDIRRDPPRRDGTELLQGIAENEPVGFIRELAPQTTEYARLMKVRMRLEAQMAEGGWGPRVPAGSLRPGNSGNAVIALRDRLVRMGYLQRSASSVYDVDMQKAVQAFQIANGIEPDGVAGGRTMTELNKQIEDRLPSIIVAMERERWLNVDRGDRHVLVNLTDFSAVIMDDGKERFRTRSVVGANDSERRTYEFSDTMEYMEINPYWNLPRSIAMDYIPAIMANPGAAGHLELVNGNGQAVSRSVLSQIRVTSARTFPFDLRQPPGPGNALGRVKYMFPNPHAIYLHDTPAKSLFSREVRMFSHGCIRLNDPFEFGYVLLERQEENPKEFFHRILDSWENTKVYLETPIPVHLIYRTAFTTPRGEVHFRPDHYGRDAKVFRALQNAGVRMPAVES